MQDQYLYDNDTFAVICEVNYQGPFKYNHMKGRKLEKYLFDLCNYTTDQNLLSDACKNIKDGTYLSESYKYMKSIRDEYTWGGHYISFKKFGCLYEPFEKFLLDIHQNGIFWMIHDRVMNDTAIPEHDDPRVVLTLEMLSAGFLVWLFCMSICCIVFACEIIIEKIEPLKKNCEIVEIIDLTCGDIKIDSVDIVSIQTEFDSNILDENLEVIEIIDISDAQSRSSIDEDEDEDDKDSVTNSTHSRMSMYRGEENFHHISPPTSTKC